MGDTYGNLMLAIMKAATGLVKKNHPEGCPLDFEKPVQGVSGRLNGNLITVNCGGKRKEGEFDVFMDVCKSCPFFGMGNTYRI